MMGDDDITSLAEDIKRHGLRAPITILDGKILDGNNRFRACKIAKVEIKTRQFENGSDPLEFVLSANLHRRHLTESQRAIVAAKWAKMGRGEKAKIESANLPTPPTITEAAAKLNVSPRLVQEAKIVVQSKHQTRAVESGEKTVHKAAAEIKAKKAEKEIRRDETGYPIPEALWELWARRTEVEDILKAISKARCIVKAAHEREDVLYQPSNLNGALAKLHDAYTTVAMATPYAVCVTCQGRTAETCTSCKGRGLISKHHYEKCVPEELKNVRDKMCVK